MQYTNYKFAISNVSNFQKKIISLKESVSGFALCKNSDVLEFHKKMIESLFSKKNFPY